MKNESADNFGDIDWDGVSGQYHDIIFSPFAAEMTKQDADSAPRNLLLAALQNIPPEQAATMHIADYGCGPGNLLPHIQNMFKTVAGIERDAASLRIAQSVAEGLGLAFTPIHEDFKTHAPAAPYDAIVAVNSVLPPDRADVLPALTSMQNSLQPDGVLLAIMPSYDTCEHLAACYEKHATADELDDFLRSRIMDKQDLSVQLEGCFRQCYHSPESIGREFALAGLSLVGVPQKVYYPWRMAEKFGYGYFPQEEEVWDWFVMAKPTTRTQPTLT